MQVFEKVHRKPYAVCDNIIPGRLMCPMHSHMFGGMSDFKFGIHH